MQVLIVDFGVATEGAPLTTLPPGLAGLGDDIVTVGTLAEVHSALVVRPFDVAVFHPNSGDWIEQLKQILEISTSTPIALLTDETSETVLAQARRLGVVDILIKPMNAVDLLQRLRLAVAYSESQDELLRFTMGQVVKVLLRVESTLSEVQLFFLENPEQKKNGISRVWGRIVDLLDPGSFRLLLWILAGILAVGGSIFGIDFGLQHASKLVEEPE